MTRISSGEAKFVAFEGLPCGIDATGIEAAGFQGVYIADDAIAEAELPAAGSSPVWASSEDIAAVAIFAIANISAGDRGMPGIFPPLADIGFVGVKELLFKALPFKVLSFKVLSFKVLPFIEDFGWEGTKAFGAVADFGWEGTKGFDTAADLGLRRHEWI